jgi:hypothetical protein
MATSLNQISAKKGNQTINQSLEIRLIELSAKIVNSIILVIMNGTQCLIRGLAVSLLWNWFIASYFHIQQLTILNAIGLCFVVSVITFIYSDNQRKVLYYFCENVAESCGFMVLGFILHSIIMYLK